MAATDGSGETMVYVDDRASDFEWSPDGTELAIASGDLDSTTVRFVGLDGKERAQATHDGSSYTLSWSPDGRYVVTMVSVGTAVSVVAFSSDGATQKELFTAPGSTYLLLSGWLPSGELLVEKGESTLPAELLAFDIEEGTSRVVADIDIYADFFGRPAVSPDGRSLAVIAPRGDKGCGTPDNGNSIWTIDLESGVTTQVSPVGYCGGGGIVWSSDGTQIAFSVLGVPDTSGVFVTDVATREARQLASGLNNVVAWLDDGTILAEQYACVNCDGGGPPKVLAIDSATGDVREVTGRVPTGIAPSGQIATADEAIEVVDLTGAPVRELAPVEADWRYLSLEWSPDEKHVAYMRDHATGQHFYEVNADGSGFEMVGAHVSPTVRLSADGSRMAYLEPGDSTKDKAAAHLWLADADGSNASDLGIEGVISFAWPPDGQQLILATVGIEGGLATLYLVNADGSGLMELETSTTVSVDSMPGIWSPDGSMVAFTFGDVFVVEIETGEVRYLAQTADKLSGQPSWSADSKKLVYGRGFIGRNGSEIVILNADGSGSTTILSDDRYTKTSAIFSPGGKQIAFLTSGPEKDTKIEVANIDGSGERTVAQGALLGSSIAWSPNGNAIAAAIAFDGDGGLFLISADGLQKRQLTQGGAFNDITWLGGSRLRFATYQGGL